MSVLPVGFGSSSGADVGDIGHSLRLRASASAYLSRTPGSAGNRKTWTWSGWVKRGSLGVLCTLFASRVVNNDSQAAAIYIGSDDKIGVLPWSNSFFISSAVFRDPSAHFHVVVAFDTTQATATNRVKVYVNGVDQAGTYPLAVTLNADYGINQAGDHRLGDFPAAGFSTFDGYLSRICFVDGQALTPSSFGYLNSTINEWTSKSASAVKAVVDAGGTNSFMLDFNDATSLTTLGNDYSSKNNDWTLNNFSLSGVTYDHMLDGPGNSFAVLNPLVNTAGYMTYGSANLYAQVGAVDKVAHSGFQIPSSGKWYFEYLVSTVGLATTLGVSDNTASQSSGTGFTGGNFRMYRADTGQKTTLAVSSAYGATFTTNDTIGVAVDMDAGTIVFYKNNVSQGVAFSDLAGGTWFPASYLNSADGYPNFGQRPFAYAPPTGFKALCQRNLPDVATALLDPTDHHIDITVTKSGDTSFTLPWNATTYDTFFEIKRRDAAGDWYQIDGLRGYDKILKSNSTAAETTDANVIGVSGTTCTLKSTLSDGTYIISATKAGLSASRQTNTDGTITSTVSRNVVSGFAIVTYTTNSGTIGHGLGAKPALLTTKDRNNGATNWHVWHKGLSSETNAVLQLNTTSAQLTAFNYWGSAPTTTTFGDATTIYGTGKSIVAYCYADSPIQKSFSYKGNGSTDGPYVNLGFKCGRAFFKPNNTSNWNLFDSARSPNNVNTGGLRLNLSQQEVPSGSTDINIDMDALSVKIRGASVDINPSGILVIGHAWAATTGKYSLAR